MARDQPPAVHRMPATAKSQVQINFVSAAVVTNVASIRDKFIATVKAQRYQQPYIAVGQSQICPQALLTLEYVLHDYRLECNFPD